MFQGIAALLRKTRTVARAVLRRPKPTPVFDYHDYQIPTHLVRMTGAGPETFDQLSISHMRQLERYTPIHRDHHVLEIGCGIGRDAIPLTRILGPSGSYTGVDIIRDSINWCSRNISRRHPNFHFKHYDVGDQLHNPHGRGETREISLPLQDGSIDRIIVQSVFTHIFESEVIHFLKEFRRVLKPEGLALVTFFLVDPPTLEHVRQEPHPDLAGIGLGFRHDYGNGCYINDPEFPGGAVAYTGTALERMLDQGGLEMARPIGYGHWSGLHPETSDAQDMVVLRRRPEADEWTPSIIPKLDRRTLRTNYDAIREDIGGDVSHVKAALIERFCWLEAILQTMEHDIATGAIPKDENLDRWIQAVNSLTELAKLLGIARNHPQ